MNRRISRINDAPPALPRVLDDVLDGEVEVHDPRARAALADPKVARAFRSTGRVTRQLERMPRAPDLTDAILARVGEHRPFARRQRWLTSARLAGGAGVLLSLALAVALVISRPPQLAPERLAAARPARPIEPAGASVAPVAATLTPPPVLPLGNAEKYEASFASPDLASVAWAGEDVECGLCPVRPKDGATWAWGPGGAAATTSGAPPEDGLAKCRPAPEYDQRGLPVDVVDWLDWHVST